MVFANRTERIASMSSSRGIVTAFIGATLLFEAIILRRYYRQDINRPGRLRWHTLLLRHLKIHVVERGKDLGDGDFKGW